MAGFCTQCGTQRPDGARFCANCGAAFGETAAPPPADTPGDAVADAPAEPLYPGVEEELVSAQPSSPEGPAAVEPTSEMPLSHPGVAAAAPANSGYPVASSPNRGPLMLGGIAVAAVVVAGFAWWAFSDVRVNGIQPKDAATAAGESVVGTGPVAVAEAPYVDTFLTTADEAMVTRGPVALLAVPGVSSAAPLRSLPEHAPLTGRWVRGTDGNSRWFRLASGGYLPQAAVVSPAAVLPARARPFDLDAAFGNALNGYFDAAQAEHQRAMELAQKKGGDELAANGFAAVPSRSMHGLTVTAVGSHWESSTIMFRENVATVRAALQAEGWRVAGDGTVETSPQEAATCSIGPTSQWPEFARYGATVLSCGL